MPAPTPPTIRVEFRGGPYSGETRDMCEPLRDTVIVADTYRRVTYHLESYWESARMRVGHVYVADPPPRPFAAPDQRVEVLRQLDTAIDRARRAGRVSGGRVWAQPQGGHALRLTRDELQRAQTGRHLIDWLFDLDTRKVVAADPAAGQCQACGVPLCASPSDEFCDAVCQRAWHAERTDPLPASVPAGWPSWADSVPYGDHTIRADECVEGQRPRPGPYGHTDGPDGCDVEFDEGGGCGGCSCHMGHAPCGHCTDVAETPPDDDDQGVTLFGVLLAQLEQTRMQRMAHLREIVERLSDLGDEAARDDTTNREGDQCAATPDVGAPPPPAAPDTSSTGTGAPPEASPT